MTTATIDLIGQVTALAERGHGPTSTAWRLDLTTHQLRHSLPAELYARLANNAKSSRVQARVTDAALAELNEAIDRLDAPTPCAGQPDLWADPNGRQALLAAARKCDGCPILTECRNVAPHMAHGVYGGVVRLNGKWAA